MPHEGDLLAHLEAANAHNRKLALWAIVLVGILAIYCVGGDVGLFNGLLRGAVAAPAP